MKIIRYFTIALLLITGILHLYSSLRDFANPNAITVLGFGIVYFFIGALLFSKLRFPLILGIAFPCLGLAGSLLVAGFHNWTALTALIYAIDVVVIICCVFLLLSKTKKQKE
jgi:hypothetical protein